MAHKAVSSRVQWVIGALDRSVINCTVFKIREKTKVGEKKGSSGHLGTQTVHAPEHPIQKLVKVVTAVIVWPVAAVVHVLIQRRAHSVLSCS